MTHRQHNRPRAVTLQDIANHCGISKVAVSMALRGNTHEVSVATIERVRAVAAQLGYDPTLHESARRLALSRNGRDITNYTVALFFPQAFKRHLYFMAMLQGILDVMTEEGYALIIAYIQDEPTPQPLSPIFSRGDVDGVIAIGNPPAFQQLLERLRGKPRFGDRPVVSLVRPIDGCSAVLTNDRPGAYALANHLLNQGHRHLIYFVGKDIDYAWGQRALGLEQAYRDRGLDPEQYRHKLVIDFQLPPAERIKPLLMSYLAAHPEVTAIVAPTDHFALQIHEILRDMGLSVPQDISLTGFDDDEVLPDAQGNNILTTVRIPLGQLGVEAAKLITRKIAEDSPSLERILLPTEFIPRESTAPPTTRRAAR